MDTLVEMLQPIKKISRYTRSVKPLIRSQQLRGVGTQESSVASSLLPEVLLFLLSTSWL